MKRILIIVLVASIMLSFVRLIPYIERYGLVKVIEQYKRYIAYVVFSYNNDADTVLDSFTNGFNADTFASLLRALTSDVVLILSVPIVMLFLPGYVIENNHSFGAIDGSSPGGVTGPFGGNK